MKKDSSHDHKDPKDKERKDHVTLSRSEYDQLLEKSKKSDEYYDKWLRVHADFENTRKRPMKITKTIIAMLTFVWKSMVPHIGHSDPCVQEAPTISTIALLNENTINPIRTAIPITKKPASLFLI